LKLRLVVQAAAINVAPRVGAWIETNQKALSTDVECRAPRGRVD